MATNKSRRPASSMEAIEARVTAKAMKLAEKKIDEGTASSQLICHFLKLGTERDMLEREKLRKENNVLEAKAEAYKQAEHIEELYAEAIESMKEYKGQVDLYEN